MNVITQGLLTNYTADGDPHAPVVLLLHGWGASLQNLDDLATRLAADYRVLRLDFPGFGGTQTPPSAWHVHDYAVFTAAFLEKLGITQLRAVVGHSFGGRIVISGLADGLLPATRAVLLDSAGLKPAATGRTHAFRLVAQAGRLAKLVPGLASLAPALRRRLYSSAGSQDYLDAGELRQTFLNVINEDLSAAAARITVPTLLIWGAEDRDTPPADGKTLANLIPNSSFSLVAGAGHFVHNDAAERVYPLITRFLR